MKLYRSLIAMSVTSALLAMSGNAEAAAFALIEQSSGLGNAFAGGAAGAEDATTIFFNPAGMSRLKGNQVTVAGSLIQPSIKFSNTGSTAAAFQPFGDNGGDAGSLVLVPNTYMVMEVEPALRFGLGINSPFGLQTQYDPTWVGRFQAINSKIRTINLNPSFSYEMNDSVSLGLGLSYQHITGDLSNAVNYTALSGGLASGEGISSMSGSDSSWGYNFGVLFNVAPDSRIGLSYRSKIKYNLNGSVSFSNVPAVLQGQAALQNGNVSLPISMPDMLSISGFHQLNDKWDVMADASRTGWSVMQQMVVSRANGSVLQTTPEHWTNTWRFSLGSTYHYNEQWLARVGVAYDQTPVPAAYLTARIPDNNRTWLTFGGQYKVSDTSKVDFGYAHLFVKDTSIANNQTATGAGDLVGTFSSSINIVTVQYAYNF
ncbi:outer membrane protein transport protein [Sideroxydans sp. CL21]|uniref:OmpP1/FadL family transporter n=1 Tax=Sideroxydans sp. CL21 TaxID=2600596 RepID=UPI0024BD3961|nr:outer membrane protein transport protein [Sideroxydans sp. CL21]